MFYQTLQNTNEKLTFFHYFINLMIENISYLHIYDFAKKSLVASPVEVFSFLTDLFPSSMTSEPEKKR